MITETGGAVATGAVAYLSLSLGGFFTGIVERQGNPGHFRRRSACPACRNQLAWYDVFPVLSWCWLKARCRHCAHPISLFYPCVELAALATGMMAVFTFQGIDLLAALLLGWMLLLLAAFDVRHYLLPWPLTGAVAMLGFALGAVGVGLPWDQRFVGWAGGFCALEIVRLAYRRWRGREGLGGGDVWLFAAAGAWVGPFGLPWVLFLAAGGALLMAGICRLRRQFDPNAAIPFGAWLSAGLWLVYVGQDISQ